MRCYSVFLAVALAGLTAGQLPAAVVYSNGFETNVLGWNPTRVDRVSSGTNGVPSSSGAFHGQFNNGGSGPAFTGWGATAVPSAGYNFGAGSVPTAFQPYSTSIDVYLDVGANYANNTRLDFSSAISNAAGGFRRDFIFNGGFFDDLGGPGSGTDRFVFSASNNSQPGSAFAKNPARDPVAISTTGWYTFEHVFYDNGGVLAVDLSIYDEFNALINTWTLSDPSDLIGLIGGNRYGWFNFNELGVLAFDNAQLSTLDAAAVPEPASLAVWSLAGIAGLCGARRRRKARGV